MKKGGKVVIRNAVTISDLHCGCQFGLCPDAGAEIEEGWYTPSPLQKKVWAWWQEFWEEWVPIATHGEPYCVVLNGDAIDGVHHRATTQFTHNLTFQRKLGVQILKPIVDKCEGRFYMVKGTAAHVGESGCDEEAMAKELGAIPNEDGKCARYELWLSLGDALVHYLHHIGTTGSSAHEASAVNAELTAEFVEAARWGEKPPSVLVRSHRHRNIEVRIPTKYGFATATVTPAWQLKTPFCYRIPGARLAPPQIGGILIRQGDRAIYTDPKVWHIGRSRVESVLV